MKYIRTKKGKIYERDKVIVVKENGVEIVLLSMSADFVERTRGKTWNYGTNVVVKESDNLEELFDECLYLPDSDIPHVVSFGTDQEGKRYVIHWSKQGGLVGVDLDRYKNLSAFRGAIYTDKGLIYVAKLNEKGEFELL